MVEKGSPTLPLARVAMYSRKRPELVTLVTKCVFTDDLLHKFNEEQLKLFVISSKVFRMLFNRLISM